MSRNDLHAKIAEETASLAYMRFNNSITGISHAFGFSDPYTLLWNEVGRRDYPLVITYNHKARMLKMSFDSYDPPEDGAWDMDEWFAGMATFNFKVLPGDLRIAFRFVSAVARGLVNGYIGLDDLKRLQSRYEKNAGRVTS